MSKTDINKNKIVQSLWLLTMIITGLFLLSIIPEISIGTLQFKRIDLLSDLHPDPPVTPLTQVDTAAVNPGLSIINTSNVSIIPIEDYSGDKKKSITLL